MTLLAAVTLGLCGVQAGFWMPGALADEAGKAGADALFETYTREETKALGLPFSEAVRAGNILYLSGQIGVKPGTMELVPGGMEAEARQTMENIGEVLAHYGADFSNIAKCTVMLADMGEWADFNKVYVTYFGDGPFPARSAFGASGLALGGKLEVECMAVLPEKS
ncbi:Rid family detoxifying hydrolase [Tepidicaulis sp.]|uniref:Rid family detoxifying hydrolase n=1 Tax=Tepidicaulis sp. TaxID=1920809 RepID=UPI003B59F6F4